MKIESSRRFVTSRRKFLTGIGAGAGILLPMFRTMLPEAMGQETTRKRLFIYAGAVSANERHFPKSGGNDSLEMTPAFSPLDPYQQDMVFLRGLDCPWDKQQHGPDWFMTGFDGRPGGITLDRYIAKETGGEDPVTSIQLAMTSCPAINSSVCADGKGQIFPAQTDPVRAYSDIFGGGIMAGNDADRAAAAAESLAKGKSLLDFVRGDISRMQTQLAGPEKEKLDQYLTGLQELEGELQNFANAQTMDGPSCSNVGEPNPGGGPGSDGHIQAQLAVAANALICGMTRVAVLHKNCSNNYGNIGGIGGHDMWHGTPGEDGVKYYNYHAGNIAKVRAMMEAVPEGNGTAADSTLQLYFERSGIHHHNGQGDSFIMMIGNPGGYLNTGRHLNYKGHRVNDAFVSISNAMGVDTDTFGDSKWVKGPLPGLAA